MNIIIVGAGTVGTHIATQLIYSNMDVTLIEKDPEHASYVSEHLDCLVINDDGNDIAMLKRAGIQKADFFISVTDSDEVNMIACGLVSSEFDVPFKIARVRNLDYSGARIFEKKFLDIDFVVNPEVEAAKVISQTISLGASSNVMLFEKTNVQLRNFFVEPGSAFSGKTLKEVRENIKEDFLIAGIARKEQVLIPSGTTVIKDNDTLFLVAAQENLEKIFERANKPSVKIRKVLIVGGNKIGTLVAGVLLEQGYSLKIIDKDYERCRQLSTIFTDSLIINADISDEGIFSEERLYENDLIITTTDSQETNILAAIYAKSLGVKRAIAVVSKTNYLNIARELGIDSTIDPKSSAADAILKFIFGRNIESVHSIFEGKAEIIEAAVGENFSKGIPLKDLDMPDNSLIISVSRENKNYIPHGDFHIQNGDNVLIITNKKSTTKIIRMFSQG